MMTLDEYYQDIDARITEIARKLAKTKNSKNIETLQSRIEELLIQKHMTELSVSKQKQ